ncbi:MAG: SIS domain-containing protein [Spirochaetaceae bacterium]|jgi:uncharacterized phosphosugar-binding protein|nr:SIS domain-containing protein [Spirochaetaceae bacterium]
MLAKRFFTEIHGLINTIQETQTEAIQKAAEEIAPRLERGGLLYVFGSGHSHVLAEEVFSRAGGLIQAKSIVPHELTVDLDMDKSTLMERTDGLAEIIFSTTKIRKADILILVSNSGRNAVPVQMALGAKQRGIFTIGMTNVNHSKGVSPRDKSGKKLYELCDVVLDTCGPKGDALLQPPGKSWAIAPVSTIVGAVIMEALVCAVVETMLSHGVEPPVYQSANIDGNDDYNRRAREQLKERFPELREVFSTF